MRSLRALMLVVVGVSVGACELVADFDRGKLDAGKPPDAGQAPIVPEDPEAMDAGASDAAVDAQ